MTKADIAGYIAARTGITNAQAREVLAAYTNAIQEALAHDNRIVLPGIGSLTVTARPAREGRNPRTGDKLVIAAGKKITFKAAKELKDTV